MSWVEHGCYRHGTVEMMNSPCVLVAYLASDNSTYYIGVGKEWNNKKYRQLVIVDPAFITTVRPYPNENTALDEAIISWIQELMIKNIDSNLIWSKAYSYDPASHCAYDWVKKTPIVDDENVKGEKIYNYVNHILSRLEMVVKDTNYLYLMNDSATPLEELLMKLIRHFKSYTVDLLGMDILYVCDLKSENLIRLFDEIAYMEKTIGIDEGLNLSYSDVVRRIISEFTISDKLSWNDKVYYTSLLLIDNSHGIYNSVRLRDEIYRYKEILINESIELYDAVHSIEETLYTGDSFHLKDGVVAMWYSDAEEDD
jgi:hypothetical protein